MYSPGKGVLVKQDNAYYYPGRLICWDKRTQSGTVQMWRGIQNDLANHIIKHVPITDIADGLWQDQEGRRKIRVCFFIPVCRSYPDTWLV